MTETKAKINLREGTIELEGSESFVEKYLNKYEPYLQTSYQLRKEDSISQSTLTKRPKRNTANKQKASQVSYAPIPLELKGDSKKPSLKDFFKEKMPESNTEIVTVFAYYMKTYLGIEDMQVGHVVSCYNEINMRKPKNILQLFSNVAHHKGWLKRGSLANTATITLTGEDLVIHDLPHKKASELNAVTRN